MLDRDKFNNILIYLLIAGLFILAFLIIKSIISSIIFGVLLAYIFYPIYQWIYKKIKNKNISALIVCIGLLMLIIIATGIILGSLLKQIIEFSVYLKGVNWVNVIKTTLPEFIATSETSATIVKSLKSSLSMILEDFITQLGNLVLNIPAILLQLLIVFLIFFFSLKDGEEAFEYLKSLLPFKKEIQEKFFKQFKDITQSVLVGQIVVGVIQGIVAGIGYFIFGVPNALLLTLLTIIVGVIPIIGPWLVWVPVDVYLFATGMSGAGIGLLIYGLFLINWIDIVIRPMIVSRKTQINSAIVLVGMIGGLFVFGILGLIIGPLILGYILLVIEMYRKDKVGEDLIFKRLKEPKRPFPNNLLDKLAKSI